MYSVFFYSFHSKKETIIKKVDIQIPLINFEWQEYIKKHAIANEIPLVEDIVGQFLYETVRKTQPLNVLEIGFGSGYSSFFISEGNPKANIISLEKDKERFENGLKIIDLFKKNINLLNLDFFEFAKENKIKFDFVFIDGAKAQYLRYIKTLEAGSLENGAIIVSDNIFLRNKVFKTPKKKKDKRIVNKMKEFCEYIKSNNFETQFLSIGDGISVSTYKKR